jgi:hypothetical protein
MSVSSIPAPQKPKPAPRFIFADKSSVTETYESFKNNGFEPSEPVERVCKFEKQFLSSVDLSKSLILVTVGNIVRIMAIDWTSPERQRREYYHYLTHWEAKNFKNNTIRYTLESQGKFIEQTKQIETRRDQKTGEDVDVYVRGTPRECFTMEWDKKKAQDILTNKKAFGEDSINITNLAEVQYTAKFPNSNPGRTEFDKEDFMNLTYQALWDKARTTPSPQLEALKRKQNPYG